MKNGVKPYPPRVTYINPHEFTEALSLFFVRHPDSGLPSSGGMDYARDWRPEGEGQAEWVAGYFRGVELDSVISSGVWRAHRLALALVKDLGIRVIQIPTLGFAGDENDAVEVMFRDRGQMALRGWQSHPLWGCMEGFGFIALNALMERVVDLTDASSAGVNVAVIGHAVNLAAMVLAIGNVFNDPITKQQGLDEFLDGGDMFQLSFTDSGPTATIIRCPVNNQPK